MWELSATWNAAMRWSWIYLIDDNILFSGLWRGRCDAANADAATAVGSAVRVGRIVDVVVAAVAVDWILWYLKLR